MDFEKRMKRMMYLFVALCFMLSFFALSQGALLKIKKENSEPVAVEQPIKFKRIMKIKPYPAPKLIEPEMWRVK